MFIFYNVNLVLRRSLTEVSLTLSYLKFNITLIDENVM